MSTLQWIGKDKTINHHQDVPLCVLDRTYSFDDSGEHKGDNGNESKIIHGSGASAELTKRLLRQGEYPLNLPRQAFSMRVDCHDPAAASLRQPEMATSTFRQKPSLKS